MIKRIITGVLTLAVIILPLIGCGDEVIKEVEVIREVEVVKEVEVIKEVPTGISQYEYDKVVAELNATNAKIEGLEGEISQKSERIAELEQQVNEQTNESGATTPAPVITSAKDLAYFLIVNYGLCETSLGRTYFTFDILENDSRTSPYDYWIQVEYDSGFFFDLKYSKDVTKEMNHKVSEELKTHQEKLAKAVIELMPDKKFYGGYYDSWYTYPTLKVDLITRHYYSWVNYAPASILTSYDKAKISDFTWHSLIDDELGGK